MRYATSAQKHKKLEDGGGGFSKEELKNNQRKGNQLVCSSKRNEFALAAGKRKREREKERKERKRRPGIVGLRN